MGIYDFNIDILVWTMKKHYGINLNDKVLPIIPIDVVYKDGSYYDINNNKYIKINSILAKQI